MILIQKFLFYFTFIALSTYVQADDEGMSVKEIAGALMSFGEECDPKPEEEHIIEVVKNVEDAQYISKCFRHCMLAQFELLSICRRHFVRANQLIRRRLQRKVEVLQNRKKEMFAVLKIQEGSTVLDKEKTVEMMGSMFSERKDELGEIIDDCNEKNQGITEKCENAHAHGICIMNQMQERGFDLPDLKDE